MPIVYTKKNKTFTLPAPQARFTTRMPICGRFWGKDKGMGGRFFFARAYEAGVRSLVALYDPLADRSEETPDARAFFRVGLRRRSIARRRTVRRLP